MIKYLTNREQDLEVTAKERGDLFRSGTPITVMISCGNIAMMVAQMCNCTTLILPNDHTSFSDEMNRAIQCARLMNIEVLPVAAFLNRINHPTTAVAAPTTQQPAVVG